MPQRQIVLTGFSGSGMTSFFNFICRTNQPVNSGGISTTRYSFLKEAAYGSGFRVLDTPGYGSKTEKIIHAVGILNALSKGPVSQILLIVKWEKLNIMQDYIKSMVVKFRRFKHLLTVAVTHWDMVDKETIKENQEQVFKLSKNYGINSVIFVSKFDSGEKVCAQIDSILDKCQAEQIELTEAEFYSNFDLVELKSDIELELECQKEDIELKFKKIANVIKKFIKEFDEKNPSMHEIMHQLTLKTKRIAEDLIQDFEKKNNHSFSKLFEYHSNPSLAYLVHFELKKALILEIDGIIKLSQEKMKSDKNHFFNFIKACPHCGLVWLKVQGACLTTYCGNFPTCEDSNFLKDKVIEKYTFNITEKEINYSLITILKPKIYPYSIINNEPSKKLGCGKEFIWNQLPPLSQQQLYELIDPGLVDYFAKEVPNELLIKAQKLFLNQIEQIKKENNVIKL